MQRPSAFLRRRAPTIAAALVASLLAMPSRAAPPDPGPLAVKVIETRLLPAYERFAAATGSQRETWTSACRTGAPDADLAKLQDAFQTASDSWSAVEFVTVGPVSTSLRPDRIFGPDRRNYVAKALSDLAARAKSGEITPDVMRSVSVAGQGFPALERVIYEPGTMDGEVRCHIGIAIAGNLASIAAEVLAEWRSDVGPLAKLKRGEGDPLHFADPAQAAARLMTDLAGGVQRVNDLKLIPVLGSGPDSAKPKSAEGWRSGRSARAIRITVDSLAGTAAVLASAAPASVAAVDAKAFDAAKESVAKLPDDLGDAAADPRRRKGLEAAVAALKAAQRDLAGSLAPALGLPLGFNALDGD